MRPGLCSVTFRQLEPQRIVALAADAGLEVIEWGGDLHVPPGDAARAASVAAMTADAGLAVCSYGSYFRADAGEDIAPVLDSAEALGADRVRVWAGRTGSADASGVEWNDTAGRLSDACSAASDRGITLALEYHGGTLADNPQATLRLLHDVGSPALSAYWQPTVGATDGQALAEYAAIAERVSAVHVFSWWPRAERLRLREREGLWRALVAAATAAAHPPRDALLEFVPDDDPELLAEEAATLRAWLADAAGANGIRG